VLNTKAEQCTNLIYLRALGEIGGRDQEFYLEMMEPPEKIKENEEKMKRWKPPVKKDIDWERVIQSRR